MRGWKPAWCCSGSRRTWGTRLAIRSCSPTCRPGGAPSARCHRALRDGTWGAVLSGLGQHGVRGRRREEAPGLGRDDPSWSRACYVELLRKADTATSLQCHGNAFEYLGGVLLRCLYDNAKVVTLGKDEDGQVEWNLRMPDFARRLGLNIWLCQPYRAETKGKVECGRGTSGATRGPACASPMTPI